MRVDITRIEALLQDTFGQLYRYWAQVFLGNMLIAFGFWVGVST